MKNKVWLLWVLILFTMARCTQKEKTTYHIQPLYARAATYQLGSYYVFRDSVTHGLDSFYVTICDTSTYNNGSWNETIFSGFKNDNNYEFEIYSIGSEKYLNLWFSTNLAAYKVSFIYGYDLKAGKVIDLNKCIQIHDSISIDNRVYYKVYETLFQYNSNTDPSYLHKWYSLQDGLIKMRIHGNGVDKVYTTLRHLQLN